MLSMPPHIAATKVAGRPVDYEWDEENSTSYYNHYRKELTNQLMRLTPRASLALAAGLAEWVVWRLDGLNEYRDVADFVEAAWVSVIDPRYCREWTRQGKDLRGPVLGPQWAAARFLDLVMRNTWERESTISRCQYLVWLSQHLWKQRKAFREWRTLVFDRLLSCCPMSRRTREYHSMRERTGTEPFDFGDPLPREILDPKSGWTPETTPKLLDTFLCGLDHTKNRFLRSPEEVIQRGLTTPYRYPTQGDTINPEFRWSEW